MDRKFRIKSPAHSKAIQERLFELGYSWLGVQQVKHTEKEELYSYDEVGGKRIYHSDRNDEEFDKHKSVESTLDDLFNEEFFRLNEKVSAFVRGDFVEVEYQKIPKNKIKEFAEILKKTEQKRLENLKFRVKGPEHRKALKERFSKMGFSTMGVDTHANYFYLYAKDREYSFGVEESYFLGHLSKEATLDDLFDNEVTTFKLTDSWTAEISDKVKIGCQTFEKETLIAFADTL